MDKESEIKGIRITEQDKLIEEITNYMLDKFNNKSLNEYEEIIKYVSMNLKNKTVITKEI